MHKCCMGVADAEARPVQEILVEDGYRAVSAYLDQRDTAALNSSPWTPFRDGDLDTAAGPAGSPLIGDGHGPPGLPSAALASWPTAWAAGNRAILPATHTIGVAQCALRRSLRSARPAELAGRSCLHRWARSGLPHPGGLRRENPAPLSLDCRFGARRAFEKCRGAKGIRTPDLLHAMPAGFVWRCLARSRFGTSGQWFCLPESGWVCCCLGALSLGSSLATGLLRAPRGPRVVDTAREVAPLQA